MPDRPFVARLDGDTASPPAEVYALPDGTPARKYCKKILATGRYTHPKDLWRWDVDAKEPALLEADYTRMRANGLMAEVTLDPGRGG